MVPLRPHDRPLGNEQPFQRSHPQVKKLQPLLLEWEKGKVETWGRNFEGIKQMSEEDRKRLRSLGYVR